MEFKNRRTKKKNGQFTDSFNELAGRVLDESAFYAMAEKAGWHEARIFKPGMSLAFEQRHIPTRISALVDSNGVLEKFRFG
jgi:hypothetical protein